MLAQQGYWITEEESEVTLDGRYLMHTQCFYLASGKGDLCDSLNPQQTQRMEAACDVIGF